MNTVLIDQGVVIIVVCSLAIAGLTVASELVLEWSINDQRYTERMRRYMWRLFSLVFISFMFASGLGILLGFIATLMGLIGIHK